VVQLPLFNKVPFGQAVQNVELDLHYKHLELHSLKILKNISKR
jgi:hypothetical protein